MSWVKWQRGEDMRKKSRRVHTSTIPPVQMYKHENKAFAQAFGCERQTNTCQCKHWPDCIPLQSVLWVWIRDGISDRLKQINTLLYYMYTIYILVSLRKAQMLLHNSQITTPLRLTPTRSFPSASKNSYILYVSHSWLISSLSLFSIQI